MGGSLKDQLGREAGPLAGNAPAVILVNPQLGENIGAAARAMLNFGLTDLRLVAPRDGWPNPASEPTAAGAMQVLESAKVYETTAEAVADLNFLMAATARRRELEIPVMGTGDAGATLRAHPKSGILFGPEKAGLKNADVVLCDYILTYPINPAFQSLNLAQAVILTAYEWSRIGNEGEASNLVQPTAEGESLPPAPQDELEGLITHLEGMLAPKGYFFPDARAEATRRNLRTVLTKPGWNHLEIRTLRGVLSSLGRPDKNPPDKG